MANKEQHVVPSGNEWGVRGAGNSRLTAIVGTQQEAIDIAQRIAERNHTEVVIHRPDGRIRDKDSYGHDPSSVKDTKH
jgi:hypothetical protein